MFFHPPVEPILQHPDFFEPGFAKRSGESMARKPNFMRIRNLRNSVGYKYMGDIGLAQDEDPTTVTQAIVCGSNSLHPIVGVMQGLEDVNPIKRSVLGNVMINFLHRSHDVSQLARQPPRFDGSYPALCLLNFERGNRSCGNVKFHESEKFRRPTGTTAQFKESTARLDAGTLNELRNVCKFSEELRAIAPGPKWLPHIRFERLFFVYAGTRRMVRDLC